MLYYIYIYTYVYACSNIPYRLQETSVIAMQCILASKRCCCLLLCASGSLYLLGFSHKSDMLLGNRRIWVEVVNLWYTKCIKCCISNREKGLQKSKEIWQSPLGSLFLCGCPGCIYSPRRVATNTTTWRPMGRIPQSRPLQLPGQTFIKQQNMNSVHTYICIYTYLYIYIHIYIYIYIHILYIHILHIILM